MGAYTPRVADGTVLHGVVRDHLETFLATVAARSDGVGLPAFVEREFRSFLRCGLLVHGFTRVRCDDCAFERLVPFSCKARAVCASCGPGHPNMRPLWPGLIRSFEVDRARPVG